MRDYAGLYGADPSSVNFPFSSCFGSVCVCVLYLEDDLPPHLQSVYLCRLVVVFSSMYIWYKIVHEPCLSPGYLYLYRVQCKTNTKTDSLRPMSTGTYVHMYIHMVAER